MTRGPKKHLKRLNAPKHWMLDKLTGVWAPKPSPGPHKSRESLPLIILLRNRLKYALTRREVVSIVKQRLIKVDGKVRTDSNFPAGFQDVVSIDKTNEHFRLLFDTKGRFFVHKINTQEAQFKLAKVTQVRIGQKAIPFLVTSDGRTIRYPDPVIKVNDSVKITLATGKIASFVKFEVASLAVITGGRNLGRVGTIESREKHDGGFEIIHLKDAAGQRFATRISNVFVVGKDSPLVSLPRSRGIKLSIIQERDKRLKRQENKPIAS